MVTLAGTQNFNEFELHLRAVLGLPIKEVYLEKAGASAVILAEDDNQDLPAYSGLEEAVQFTKTDIRVFGKPNTRMHRRMGIALAHDEIGTDTDILRKTAKDVADKVRVNHK
jgi:phosphoribosylglycinamide formyltransferase 2